MPIKNIPCALASDFLDFLIIMGCVLDSLDTSTGSRIEYQEQEPPSADAGAPIDEVPHPIQTSEPIASVLQANSLHSEERPEALYGQVQGDVSPTLDTDSEHLFISKPANKLEGQFVDVELFDEWTEGYVIKATEGFATVIVNHPFLSGEHIQRIPIESISCFRTKTSRSSLTSHLEACLKKSPSFDFEILIRAELLAKKYKVSPERFIQFFAGLLPLGCLWLKPMYQIMRKELFKSLICPSLIEFFHEVFYQDPELIKRVWASILEAEFWLLSLDISESVELVVAHLELISRTYCPVCIVRTYNDLTQYCPPILRCDSSIQIALQGNQLKTYVEAGLTYIDYCIRCVNWADALTALTHVLIANAKCPDPTLTAEKLNQILQDLPNVKHSSLSQIKAEVQILLLSPPYPRGVPSIDNLLAWSLVDSANICYFLTEAPSAVSLTFLRCCSSPSELNIYRNLILSQVQTLEEVVINASDVDLSPLCTVIKYNYLLCNTSTDLNTHRLLQVRYFQFITNVLHRISTKDNALNPKYIKDRISSDLVSELTLFFKGYNIIPQAEFMQEDWLAAVALENAVLKSLSNKTLLLDLLRAHLDTIARNTSLDFIVASFKDIMQYCGPFRYWMRYSQMPLNVFSSGDLNTYLKATFSYLDLCIHSGDWYEATVILIDVYTANSEVSYSLLTDIQWNSYLQQFTHYMLEIASSEVKLSVLQSLLSLPSWEADLTNLSSRDRVTLGSPQHFFTAACFVCVPVVEHNEHATNSSLMRRLAAEMSESNVKQVLGRLPKKLVVSMCFELRGHWTLSSLRKVEEIANFIKLQRRLSLWVYEKAKSLQRIPRILIREVVFYL